MMRASALVKPAESRRRIVRRRRGGRNPCRRSELPVLHPGMGVPGLERVTRKPDYPRHGPSRQSGRGVAPRQQLLPGPLRSVDAFGAESILRAMAELGPGPCATGQIAETLGVRTTSVATVRQRLIHKGMVWSQRHGETSFTVPMFDGFMKRQMPELLRHVPQPRSGS